MELTVEYRPSFSADSVRKKVRDLYGIDGTLETLPAEWDQNFQLESAEAGTFVVKIANRARSVEELDFQNAAMNLLADHWTSGTSPQVVLSQSGDDICSISDSDGMIYLMRVLTFLPGQPLAMAGPLCDRTLDRLGYAMGELDRCLLEFVHPAMKRYLRWDLRWAEWISSYTFHIPNVRRRGIVERLLLQHRARVVPELHNLPTSVIHNDANDDNILLETTPEGGWHIAGLLDFGDMLWSHTINELAVMCAYAILRMDDPVRVIARIAAGYHRARPLTELEIRAIFPLICMRLCMSVTTSAIAAEDDPHNEHRQVSDRLAWAMLERLEPIDWRDAENDVREACGFDKRTGVQHGKQQWTFNQLLNARRQRIGPSLRLSYEMPLEIARGNGQFLFDRDERGYLDCVNNICHVGHSHPKVVAALSKQAAILNTNTRYLHPYLIEYSERLTATLPDPLSVCYFVNSGSEANELAVRMARTHTGRQDVIVLEGGYHGNTQTLIDLSPYKCEGPGGRGLPDWVHKVSNPDPYRGPYRSTGEDAGRSYAEHVREVCERLAEEKRPPALFLCEPILGCGGQIVPPEGYLREAFRHVRSTGGLCVVDEVQVGMGRVGSHMWAFETQDVVPDIITMGKPIGNGHPLGAVVTTPDIARSFDNGMEFFSSFGGNPVSMAVGIAVLDVIEEERLCERATRVGGFLVEGFRALARNHPEIGNVRGMGLFIGVELVRDRESRTPATGETSLLVERLKADGILLSSEGPHQNILKIKPPMQFGETDADLLLGAVARALTEIRENRSTTEG
jgi:4-aminobutyrate aminotransferase-like enzyme/Ser/Thr protein kinase RdoA (MazF antagonist)